MSEEREGQTVSATPLVDGGRIVDGRRIVADELARLRAEVECGERATNDAVRIYEEAARAYLARAEAAETRAARLEGGRDRLRALVQLIAADDWPGLLALAASWGVPTDHPSDYELEGDHSMDARHIYPAREMLVYALAGQALTPTGGDDAR